MFRNTFITIALLFVLIARQADASTFTVSNDNGDASANSLGAALSGADASSSSNDIIAFSALFNNPQTITLSGSYSTVTKNLTSGSLTLSAPSLLTLNDGGFTIFTFVVGGGDTFSLSNLSLKGTGTGLALSQGQTVSLSNVTIADGVSIAANGINVASAQTATFSGKVSGVGGLTESGSGMLVLSSTSNTYTGGTGISGGGSVSVSSDANLGNTSGGIGLNNGTLITTTGITSSRAINVMSLGGAISVSSGQTSTFNGQIGGTGQLTADGAGTLVLGYSNNSYASTAISGGGTLSVANGGSLGTGNLAINGSTLQTTGTSAVNVFGSVTISNGATVNVVNSAQTTTLETIGGSGGLNITGSGTVDLEGNNTFTGGVTVTGATLTSHGDTFGDSTGALTLNGGTLAAPLDEGLQTSRSIVLGTNGGTVATNGVAPFSDVQLSGAVTGVGTLTVSSGTVELENVSNGYTGGTVVTGGAILEVAADGSLGNLAGNVTLNNGALVGSNSTSRTINLGAGGGTVGSYAFQTMTLAGKVTGTGGLTIGPGNIGNTVVLAGSTNDYSGGTTVAFSNLLLVQNGTSGSATGTGALNVSSDGTVGGAGTIHASTFSLQSGANIMVGTGSDVTSQMTLTGQTASTITNSTLQFNLGVGVTAGESNLLNLGATPVTFTNTGVLLSQLGSGTIATGTVFTLMTFDNPVDAAADGLTLGNNGQITGGLSIDSNSNFGASDNGYSSGTYAGSYLYIDGNDIDVAVVPEPDARALLLAALASWMALRQVRRECPSEKTSGRFV